MATSYYPQATLVYAQNEETGVKYPLILATAPQQPTQRTDAWPQPDYHPDLGKSFQPDNLPYGFEPLGSYPQSQQDNYQTNYQTKEEVRFVEPAAPVVLNQVPAPAGNWQREHKDWQSAKACYICALFFAVVCLIGLALTWPTILIARNIYRLDHTTYLQRIRFLNDNITYYEEALTNNARLCALRTNERKWGDWYVANEPRLEDTFRNLAEAKSRFAQSFLAATSAANSELVLIEARAVSACGARAAPTGSIVGDTFSSRYLSLKSTFREGVHADSRDTDNMLWRQETELVDQNWNLWLAVYIAGGVCGTALSFLAAAYANLTAKAHRCWDVGAFGNRPNTTVLGDKQKIIAFVCFFVFTVSIFTCFALENSGARVVAYNQAIYQYGHELHNIRYYDEVLSGNARLCAQQGDIRYKERYFLATHRFNDALVHAEELLRRITHDYGSDGRWWDGNQRMLNNIRDANGELIRVESRIMDFCGGGGGTTDRTLPFTTSYENQKTIVQDNLRRLDYNLMEAMDDNNGWGSNALRHGYRGASIALTILASLIGFAFMFFMMKLVNERWQSKTPGKLAIF
eukprot:CAMPEP_0206225772 /NCGR_PEP_ID=MMETSP0047_2-20121206/7724_1 /ASSEMBLY_ACC=CAM_ASM_000192 /TAXON_ID=195065 /ORGANISM="Chroomonas mesostigmatica_cf, Strain CCMP1168" /LENGTH=574 /DNA_ID=CAMNT_0053648791 /DNA_START=40 /DNA_END=1764 /DNA_ORIENTATION=-